MQSKPLQITETRIFQLYNNLPMSLMGSKSGTIIIEQPPTPERSEEKAKIFKRIKPNFRLNG